MYKSAATRANIRIAAMNCSGSKSKAARVATSPARADAIASWNKTYATKANDRRKLKLAVQYIAAYFRESFSLSQAKLNSNTLP